MEGLADQHVAFTAAQLEVEEWICQLLQLFLIRQLVWHICHRLAEPVVSADVQFFETPHQRHLHLGFAVYDRLGLDTPDWGVQQIAQPDGHRRRQNLRAFQLEPSLDVVIAVALVRLEPELARDLYLGFYLEPVYLDRVEFFPYDTERVSEVAGQEVPRQHSVLVLADWPLLEDLE